MRFNLPLLLVLLSLSFPSFGLTFDDLVKRDGLYYEKFTDVPFSGEIDEGLERGELEDGKKEGPWVFYFANGQLWRKGAYKDGKQEGPWVFYSDNGQLYRKGVYKDGKHEGPWVSYHDNGQLWRKGAYKNGKQEGPHISYNIDGSIDTKETGTFKDGNKISD